MIKSSLEILLKRIYENKNMYITKYTQEKYKIGYEICVFI